MNTHKANKAARNSERLAVLRSLKLLDTEAEEAFDRLTRLASKITNTPFSLVTLVDANRQFFKSQFGLPEPLATERQTSLYYSFCKHVVAEQEPLIIEDAREHPVLRNILTTPEFEVIGYLGMPLQTAGGVSLGSFCVIDNVPHRWTEREIEIMHDLSLLVMNEIELRANLRTLREENPATVESASQELQGLLAQMEEELESLSALEERDLAQVDALIANHLKRLSALTKDNGAAASQRASS